MYLYMYTCSETLLSGHNGKRGRSRRDELQKAAEVMQVKEKR